MSDYPEDSPVLLVGASDREDRPAGFSDHGRGDAVLAPGVGIVSTWCRTPDGAGCDGRTHTYGVAEGTSFAAPHVAGIAALLAAEGHDAAEIVTRIRTTAVDVGDRAHGHGRVDAAAALRVSDGVAATSAPAREDEPQATEPVREEVRERTTPREPEPAPRPFVEPLPEPTTEWEPGPEPASEPAADADADAEDDRDPPAGPPSEDDAQPVDQPSASSAPDAPSEVDGEVLAMADDGRGGGHELALQLLATALVGASLASWSAVARRVG